jgi:hypothetical protein
MEAIVNQPATGVTKTEQPLDGKLNYALQPRTKVLESSSKAGHFSTT